jgi:hypothetical protein
MPLELIDLNDFDVSSLKQGDEVNVILGEPNWEIVELIFRPSWEERFLRVPFDMNWPRLLAQLGCFPSASQAAKNWKAQGHNPEIEPGYEELSVGKARKIKICLYKPFREEEPSLPKDLQ